MFKKLIKNFDYSLVVIPIALAVFGLIMIYSASMVVAHTEYHVASDYFFNRQFIWFILSMIFFVLSALFPYKAYFHLFKPLILLTVAMLIIVLSIGRVAGNAQSWIEIGGMNIQPAEFAKLTLIIYLSAIFAKKQGYIHDFNRAILPPLTFTIIIFALVFVQPDLGTGMIILGIAAVVIISAGMKPRHLFGLIALGVSGLFVVMKWGLSDVQSSRFVAAYDPFSRPDKEGYQLINSYLAIGHGGIEGQGLGQSIQKFGYLPEPHTDFILAVISEELGMIGVGFVIFSLAYIVIKGFTIARRSTDTFASLLAIGISGMIGIQSVVNIGALTGLLPVTGVTLPFVSYGGSSLLLLMVSMGILVNVSGFVNMRKKKMEDQQTGHSTMSV